MKNAILKKLGLLPDATQEVEMEAQELTVTVDMAQHEAVVAQLTEAASAIEALTSQLQAAQAARAAAEAANVEMVAQAKEQVRVARLTKLEAIVGTEKAATAMATMENFDETTFDSVLGMMATTYEAESKSELFTEAGVAAEAAPAAEKDVAERLADNIAAQFKNT